MLPVSISTRNRDCDEKACNGAVVLRSKNFCWRHERHLQAVLHRDERRQESDDRLACADIPLQQPVHRLRLLHVFHDLPDGLTLARA